jgi:hypothetical protein
MQTAFCPAYRRHLQRLVSWLPSWSAQLNEVVWRLVRAAFNPDDDARRIGGGCAVVLLALPIRGRTHGPTCPATACSTTVRGRVRSAVPLAACSTSRTWMSTVPFAAWCSPMAYPSRCLVSPSAGCYVVVATGHDRRPYELRCLSPAARRMAVGAGGTRIAYTGPAAGKVAYGRDNHRK